IVIGPPGSGKTTYCYGMQQFFNGIERKTSVVNLDPANEFLPYKSAVNIADLIVLQDVMEELKLGPNGGMMYCMEFLEKNFDWLEGQLKNLGDDYILFDFPGQVELFTHHDSVKNIIERLQKLNYRDLSYLLQHLDEDPFTGRFKELNKALCELVEDYSLVGFHTLCIEDKNSVLKLVQAIDKANGYAFGGLTRGNESIMMTVIGGEPSYHEIMEVQERWLDHKDVWDEWEAQQLQQEMEQNRMDEVNE
ncbi:15950_t:CDS:2, partial [Acaulospora colombiana]